MRRDLISAIELAGVSKRYGRHAGVESLSFAVGAGGLVGFLGPNGAGKTTTLRLMTGFLRPDCGRAMIFGCDMADARQARLARLRMGYVPDVAGIDPALTARQLLDELAALQGRAPVLRAGLVDALQVRSADLTRPLGRLSRGTRQKINIIQGLQHDPDLLILDEPTEGLDPLTKRALFDLLRAAHVRGATIFFSSHTLSEVEELCDRVVLIRAGRLVAYDRIEDLRRDMLRRVRIHLAAPDGDLEAALAATRGVEQVEVDGRNIHLLTRDVTALLGLLARLPVEDVAMEAPTLESVFLRYYDRGDSNGG